MKLEIINPLERSGWDEMLHRNNQASIFHSTTWARVLSSAYGYQPLYFAEIANNEIKSVLPMMEVNSGLTGRRGVSLPFTDYCDPILEAESAFPGMVNQVLDYGRKAGWKVLELRDGRGIAPVVEPSYTYYRHTLDLNAGEDALYANFRSNHKRNIKKAIKEGVKIGLSNSFDAIKIFYTLNCKTRKKHGLPPQPFHFFVNLHRHAIFYNQGVVALAMFDGKPIAAAIFLHFGKNALYKYGASDDTYLNMRPNNLLMWEAIRYYSNKGFSNFCFGKTDPENLGLRQFKQGWGSDESKIFYFRRDLQKEEYVQQKSQLVGLHTRLFHKTPVPVLKLIGALMYRHIG